MNNIFKPKETIQTLTVADCLFFKDLFKPVELDQSNEHGMSAEALVLYNSIFNVAWTMRGTSSIYPMEGLMNPILDQVTGKFEVDETFGLLNFNKAGEPRFLLGDITHKPKDVFDLAARFFFHRLHNKLIDEWEDFDVAKALTCNAIGRIFIDITKQMAQVDLDSDLRESAKVIFAKSGDGNVCHTLETYLGFMPLLKLMLPGKVNGIDLNTENKKIIKSFSFANTFRSPHRYLMPKAYEASLPLIRKDLHTEVLKMYSRYPVLSYRNLWDHFIPDEEISLPEKKQPLVIDLFDEQEEGMPGPLTCAMLSAIATELFWPKDIEPELPDELQSAASIIDYVESE